MLEDLFSQSVSTRELRSDGDDFELFPDEMALVANAVHSRRREFATVRQCARQALAALGCPPVPILHGPRGAPEWPPGYVGTLTHCAGFRGCAVARASTHLSLGLDCEPNEPLPAAIWDDVLLPAEKRLVRALSGARPSVHWDRLIFCAKEATYKTWFPVSLRWLDFDEAVVELDAYSGSLRVRLLAGSLVRERPELSTLNGAWTVADGVLGVGIEVEAAGELPICRSQSSGI